MDLVAFHAVLAGQTARGYPLNTQQRQAVDYGNGPLWLIAGPGSGKSEVLVTRTLRVLCVDGIRPDSVILTTFTTKAARNLEDRLATYLSALQWADASLQSVDLADLRIGTLHSLCNDILHQVRYPGYQNVRLLDDVEQHLFVYRFADIAKCDDVAFWGGFSSAVPRWGPGGTFAPNRWQRVKAAVVLFNRIVEDMVDVDVMRAQGGAWEQLADFYTQYADSLTTRYRCDFAHLQKRFLEFLDTPGGGAFLDGDPNDPEDQPPLRYVLVDEYQDTNPVQERIYLKLASRAPHNLTVVGDDDQALYRFRGGTVACMVNFDRATQAAFGVVPTPVQLVDNYRSHGDVVTFFNDYVTSFPEMAAPGVRAPGKIPVNPSSSIAGPYPAVAWVARNRVADLPAAVADLIEKHLIADGIIQDRSQCVILLRSAKDSPNNAGQYLAEFRARNIPVYNPRSKSFMQSEEVQCLLAALVQVVDVGNPPWFVSQIGPNGKRPEWANTVDGWIDALNAVVTDPNVPTDPLADYVVKAADAVRQRCASKPGEFLDVNLMQILYRILSLEPFRSWRADPSKNARIAKVTRLFESYQSFTMDVLRADPAGSALDATFLNRLYYMFLAYLMEAGIDDDEDEEVIVPQGYLPVMTIHQSKGLEFPFVIVAQLGRSPGVGAAQRLEQDMAPFRQDLYPRPQRDPQLLAIEDDIRLLYVAYSRAQYGLILAATKNQLRGTVSVPGRDVVTFRQDTQAI